jgi:FtsP/CotA-like multicopper oxidase with cupredoxin domain
MHKRKTRAKVISKRPAPVFLKVLKKQAGQQKKEYIPKMENVKKMKTRWLLATILVVFLAAVLTTTQIHSAMGATTRNFTLYGSYNQGWGFNASGITSPGPKIVVEQGDTVNLTLINNDGIYANPHRFFVRYTNASSANSTEPQSSDFTTTVSYQFVATNTVGTYTYGCYYHYSMMNGYFQVVATGTIPEFQPLIMLSVLVASAAVAALVYRRKRQI